jgi:hypothetical protein
MRAVSSLFSVAVAAAAFLLAATAANATTAAHEGGEGLRRQLPVHLRPTRSRALDEETSSYNISSSESIAFGACVTLTAFPEIDDQQLILSSPAARELFEMGYLVPQQSLVVFGVCPSDRDDGEPCLNLTAAAASDAETGGGGRSLYATDLPSYMGLAGFRPQKTFDYCATCLEAKDYCESTSAESRLGLLDDPMFTDPEDDNDGTDDDEEEEESDGAIPFRRALQKAPINYVSRSTFGLDDDGAVGGADDDDGTDDEEEDAEDEIPSRRVLQKGPQVDYVSCETCRNLGCYEDVPDSNETMMGLVQWVQAQSLCQPTGQAWDVNRTRLPLYSSFACNAAGTGAEAALFLDDDCQLRIASLPYSSVLPDDWFVENGQNVISYPFTNDVDCFADPDWRVPESSDSNSSSTVSAQQQAEQADAGEGGEANPFCRELLGEGNVVALDDCGNWTPEEEGESGQAASTSATTAAESYFDQWTYTLRGEDARRPGAACAALRRMEGGYGAAPSVPTKATNGTILPPSTNGGDGASSTTSGASSPSSAACAWKGRQLVLGGALAVGAALAVGLST